MREAEPSRAEIRQRNPKLKQQDKSFDANLDPGSALSRWGMMESYPTFFQICITQAEVGAEFQYNVHMERGRKAKGGG